MNSPAIDADDRACVLAARQHDREAFARLVERHSRGVLVFLTVRMSNFAEAEDLAQETFLVAWRRIRDFDPMAPVGPWLRGIARHLLQNHWRKHRAEAIGGAAELELLVREGDESEADWAQQPEVLDALRNCLGRLESTSQLLVRERYEEGATIDDLAARMQRKASALTMHLHRIRQTLRACIEQRLTSP